MNDLNQWDMFLNPTEEILDYADDNVIVGRSKAAVEDAFLALDRAAGMLVNTSRAKYMIADQARAPYEDFVQVVPC